MTQSQLGCCGLMTEQVEESWQVSSYISGLVWKVLGTVVTGLVWLYVLLKVLVTVAGVVWSGYI